MEGGARRDGATLQMGRQVREIDGVRKRERERNRERQTKGERGRESVKERTAEAHLVSVVIYYVSERADRQEIAYDWVYWAFVCAQGIRKGK